MVLCAYEFSGFFCVFPLNGNTTSHPAFEHFNKNEKSTYDITCTYVYARQPFAEYWQYACAGLQTGAYAAIARSPEQKNLLQNTYTDGTFETLSIVFRKRQKQIFIIYNIFT